MYLIVNNKNYPLRRRNLSAQSVTYRGMTEMPETVSGTITMYRDDGFEMSTDDADSYARQVKSGTVLTLTNEPEPEPTQEPDPSADDVLDANDLLDVLLGVSE